MCRTMISFAEIWAKARHIAARVRFMPFETTTPKERAQERHRRIILTGGISLLTKGGAQLLALAIVPLTLHYLGQERYGLWLTINSFAAILTFADLGLGNGLVNAMSEANGKDDRRLAREYVSSAFFILSGVALLLAVIFAASYPWLDWPRLFNVKDALTIAETGPSMVVFIVCTLANIPLGVVQRVQLGYQQGFSNSLWQALGTIISLGMVVVAIFYKANLVWLVTALAGVPTLAAIGQCIAVFGFTHTWVRPSWTYLNSDAVKKILRLGISFFVLQLAYILAFASDNLIITQVIGPEAVTQYGVPARLFSLLSMMIGILLVPLWPAYGEAIARGDIVWVRKTLVRSLWVVLLGVGVPSIIFVTFGPQLIKLWVGSSVQPSFMLLLGLGVLTVLVTMGNTLAMFLNGAGVIKFQIIFAILMSAAAVIAKIILAGAVGITGIIWGTIFSYIFLTIIPTIIYVPRLFRRLQQKP
jgi:O-antigen/teichoic acid export membrane protein